MTSAVQRTGYALSDILDVVKRYWGYDTLRPLQEEAIRAGLNQQDSLVVLPTGGGKSLCYQVPPLLASRMDVVISPLISLMKDQVDGLQANGVPAATIHSGLTTQQRRAAEAFISSGKCRLAFLSPERVLTPWFDALSNRLQIHAFTIDEAHCISHWGHDFRPSYRQLTQLKTRFPEAGIHAFTATATQRVRDDIIQQLQLENPAVLVGTFDRPNLVYRIVPRDNLKRQVEDVLGRHPDEAVIIYCITRDETERIATYLEGRGHEAMHYHAGLSAGERRRAQEAFINERVNIIVATVAFGMGIDRSDVRCVIHAGMPQSIEHYQQETGRAGRDGLEAECILFHSAADGLRWQSLAEKTTQSERRRKALMTLLQHMRRLCMPTQCRHKTLSEYFEQTYERANCEACDVCLGESHNLEDGTRRAQMILSCVARVGQRFGMGHVVDVLRGAETDRIRSLGHHDLSTYGLMKDTPKRALNNTVFQLIEQGLLTRTDGQYPILMLNEDSWPVLRGKKSVLLLPIKSKKVKKTQREEVAWTGIDRSLFDSLRSLRRELAVERGVPPYVIFNDASLKDMAQKRPTTPEAFLAIHGVGEKKLADFGERFMAHIAEIADTP